MSKAFGPTYGVAFRRRREGKTNYTKRLALLLSRKTRLVIRKSNRNIVLQFVDAAPEGDRTRLTTVSSQLQKKFGFPVKRNAVTAYLAGLYAGVQAKAKKINEFILDMGMYTPSQGSILFAAARGVLDAGLRSPYDGAKAIPKWEQLTGDAQHKFQEVKNKILALGDVEGLEAVSNEQGAVGNKPQVAHSPTQDARPKTQNAKP